MLIRTIETKQLSELKAYNIVDKCIIEGLEHPVMLRRNTLDGFVADEIFRRGCYDVSMKNSRHYGDYMDEFNVRSPRYILDAGGNIGLAAIYFASRYPDARIITVEPDEDNFFLLRENTKPYDNIMPVRGALWNRQTELYISNRKNAVWDDGTLNAGKYTVDVNNPADETAVPAYTVDNIINMYDIDKIDILKMDVEGAEREIFSGDHSVWLPQVKILVIEHHDFYKPGATKALFKAICDYDFHFLYDNSDSLETMMFVFDSH